MKQWKPNVSQTLKMFAYGDPGAGKTTMLATVQDDPRTSPALWLNCGGNPESIRNKPNLPTMLVLEKTKDLNTLYDFFKKAQDPAHPFVTKTLAGLGIPFVDPFKSLVIDGSTELQRVRLNEIVGNENKQPGDDLAPTQIQHWGQVLQTMTMVARLLYGFEDLTVLISALERQEQDQLTGIMSYGPALWGQARSEVPAYSLLTTRLVRRSKLSSSEKKEMGEDAYSVAYFDQVGRFLAKDQYGSLPKAMPNPSIPAIMEAIYGKP